MCIIVDAKRLGAFLSDPANEDAAPIRDWLDRRGGRIVYSTGGAFATEVGRGTRAKLLAYAQAGKAQFVSADRFVDDERSLRERTDLRSDDPHVLALARWARVRLLYTADANLIADFKSKRLIDRPRGKVYSRAANARLLTRAACTAASQGG